MPKFDRDEIRILAEIGTDYLNLKSSRGEPVSENVRNVVNFCQALANYSVTWTKYLRDKFQMNDVG